MDNFIRLGQKIWEGKVRDFKKCVKCGEVWTGRSIGFDGVCPHCKEGIREIKYAPYVEIFTAKFIELNYDTGKLIEEVRKAVKEGMLDDEKMYLKCNYCRKYVGFLYETKYGIMCYDCYEMKKFLERRDKNYENR